MPSIHRYLYAIKPARFEQTKSRGQANDVDPQNNLFDAAA
jgi:hypothetical protein